MTDQQFQKILYQLVKDIKTPKAITGRPRVPVADLLFLATLKIRSGLSGRGFEEYAGEAFMDGYVTYVPHFNTILNFIENPQNIHFLCRVMGKAGNVPRLNYDFLDRLSSKSLQGKSHEIMYHILIQTIENMNL